MLKTLGSFEWGSKIGLPASISREEMESLAFIDKNENLAFMGSAGTGKARLATALAIKACGPGKRAMFSTAAPLGDTLAEKRDSGMLGRFMPTLENTGLLAIGEAGSAPLHKGSAELVSQAASERYEKKSLIITSNLEFSQWGGVLGDGRLVAAMGGRLARHSHIAVSSGESCRLAASLRRVSQQESVWGIICQNKRNRSGLPAAPPLAGDRLKPSPVQGLPRPKEAVPPQQHCPGNAALPGIGAYVLSCNRIMHYSD